MEGYILKQQFLFTFRPWGLSTFGVLQSTLQCLLRIVFQLILASSSFFYFVCDAWQLLVSHVYFHLVIPVFKVYQGRCCQQGTCFIVNLSKQKQKKMGKCLPRALARKGGVLITLFYYCNITHSIIHKLYIYKLILTDGILLPLSFDSQFEYS